MLRMTRFSSLFFLLFIAVFTTVIIYAQSENRLFQQINLTSQDTLIISEPNDFSIQMELINAAGLTQRVELPGFNTIDDLIHYPVRLNSHQDSAAVIIFYNRSSTYGAAMAFVIWRDTRTVYNQWWIEKAPCEIATIKDVDGDSIFEIVDLWGSEKYCRFEQGQFKIYIPQN